MEKKMSFAAFVMTYKRPAMLEDTIQKLFNQSLPPQKILIVDNDPEKSAEEISRKFPSRNISYFPVGYNSGPAGAAYHGLKILSAEGWDWIGWVDDDDPPHFSNQLEKLFQIVNATSNIYRIGIVGSIGAYFTPCIALIRRIRDGEAKGLIMADFIPGGHLPIIHKSVFESGLLPDPDLFFGFEDLEFCRRVKMAGFKIVISGEELIRHRLRAGRLGFSRPVYIHKKASQLWREYYSTRSMFHILWDNERKFVGTLIFGLKVLLKSVLGFFYGFNYGRINARFLLLGLIHGYQKKSGATILPNKKY